MNNPTTWLNAIWESDLPANSKFIAAFLRRYMNDIRDSAWPSLKTISEKTGLTKKTVLKYISILEEKDYLIKESGNRTTSNRYHAHIPHQVGGVGGTLGSVVGGVTDTPCSVGDTPQVVDELHTNKQLNKQDNKQLNKKFNFRQHIINFAEHYGLSLDIEKLDHWIEIRKKKKAVNSEVAWKMFVTESVKAKITPTEAINICAQKGWKGFEASWLQNIQANQPKDSMGFMARHSDQSWAVGL